MTQANRYKELAVLTKRVDNLDPAYHAAFYLLSYDPELYEIARRFVNVDGIGFTGINGQPVTLTSAHALSLILPITCFPITVLAKPLPLRFHGWVIPTWKWCATLSILPQERFRLFWSRDRKDSLKSSWTIAVIRETSISSSNLSSFKMP